MYFYNSQTSQVSRAVKAGLNFGIHLPENNEPLFYGGVVPLHLLQPSPEEAVSYHQELRQRRQTDRLYASKLQLRTGLLASEAFRSAGILADLNTSPAENATDNLVEIWLLFDKIVMHVDRDPQVRAEILQPARRIMRRPGPGYVHRDVVVRLQMRPDRRNNRRAATTNSISVGLLSWPILAASANCWHPHVGAGNTMQYMCTGGTDLDSYMQGMQLNTVEDVLFAAMQIKTMLSSYSIAGGPFHTFSSIYVPSAFDIQGGTQTELNANQIVELYQQSTQLSYTVEAGGETLRIVPRETTQFPSFRATINETRLNRLLADMTAGATSASARFVPKPAHLQSAKRFLQTLQPVYINGKYYSPKFVEDPLLSQIQAAEIGQSGPSAPLIQGFRNALGI